MCPERQDRRHFTVSLPILMSKDGACLIDFVRLSVTASAAALIFHYPRPYLMNLPTPMLIPTAPINATTTATTISAMCVPTSLFLRLYFFYTINIRSQHRLKFQVHFSFLSSLFSLYLTLFARDVRTNITLPRASPSEPWTVAFPLRLGYTSQAYAFD